MTRSWNGYLVRALNEFASLAASFRDTDPSHRIPTPAKKASIDHQRRQKKSSGTPGDETLIVLSAASIRNI